LTFESYGVRVSLASKSTELLAKAVAVAEKAFLGRLEFIENPGTDRGYEFGFDMADGVFYLFQNGEQTNSVSSEFVFFKYFNSILRITVAENAVDRVFVHAGVVGRKGKAVLFPGRSFRGKSTLVAELIKLGAIYYSDEYAVIQQDGSVEPFPREISLRSVIQEHDEVDIPLETFGAEIGTLPLSIGCVILTEFRPDAVWEPKTLTVGNGILETIPHTIPIWTDPEMSLKILNVAFANAIVAKSFRGDVKKDAVAILAFLDKQLN
jgi:hypothetical protein